MPHSSSRRIVINVLILVAALCAAAYSISLFRPGGAPAAATNTGPPAQTINASQLKDLLVANRNEITLIDIRINILSAVGYQGVGKILPAGAKPATGSLTYTTAIWDAIWITCKSVMSEVEPKTRRVIVMITDGEDTSSRASLDEAIDYAIKTDTIVFAIGIGDPAVSNGVNKSVLKKLSSETGGQVYFPTTDDDLDTSFKRIETELRSQYVVAYVPQQTKVSGPYRKIRIEITNPDLKRSKLRLFYRKNYFAGPL